MNGCSKSCVEAIVLRQEGIPSQKGCCRDAVNWACIFALSSCGGDLESLDQAAENW